MRIALLTTNLARGGAEAQVALLASALRRRNHSVAILSLLPPAAFTDAAPVCSLGAPSPLAVPKLIEALRRLRPQVLHGHMFHGNLAARLARLVCPVPVVISTLHSVAESARGSRDTRRRDLLYRLTDPLADATVAVSQAVAERHLAARAIRAGRTRVIPNGIDAWRFRPDPGARAKLRADLGLANDFVWLAAGRLMWKKDYPTLLAAAAGLNATLLIAGAGPQEAELRAAAPPNARFLGPRDDVPDLMRAADAFVLSSVVEGLPMVLLEAAASALPCVATDAGGVREAMPAGFVVRAGDPAALRAAMQHVMDLPPGERRRIGEFMRDNVAARFDIEAVAARWEALYRELLDR